jgi:hypothetical protein
MQDYGMFQLNSKPRVLDMNIFYSMDKNKKQVFILASIHRSHAMIQQFSYKEAMQNGKQANPNHEKLHWVP